MVDREDVLRARETIGDRLQHAPHHDAPLARVQMVPWLLFIAMLALSVWLAWRAFGPEDNGDPLATSLVAWATMVLDSGSVEEIAVAAARAGLQVSTSGRHIGQEAIQLHGGIGMTAEYSIGTYTSRLTVLDHLLGDGQFHLATLAASVDDHGAVEPLP